MSGLIVDSFAGGGGASLGIELALGRSPDIAINHDPEAIAMHAANHPATRHYVEDVFAVDPREACAGRPVSLAWFSPDCTHHSKAKGGKPRDNARRGLAWVVIRWAEAVRPAVIVLENVEEFQDWGPLLEDGRPDPAQRGLEYRRWRGELVRLGYHVEERQLRACDYGAPTIRKRLFVIARCDGRPIVWPEATHGPGRAHPWRTAAECIDWSIPCPSIFDRKRPLAEKTMRRIARGVWRYVINAAEPFIVRTDMHLSNAGCVYPTGEPLRTATTSGGLAVVAPTLVHATHADDRVNQVGEPLRTVTGAHRGEQALVAAYMVHRSNGERPGQAPRVYDVEKPLGTVVAQGQKHALCTAFLAKHYGGHEATGSDLRDAVATVTTQDHHALVTSHLVKFYGTSTGSPTDAPAPTITAGGWKLGEVRAFLLKYYGTGEGQAVADPLGTVTTHDRFGLVTVAGVDYQIVDIGMRMLTPRELFRAQGFHDRYIIAPDFRGKPLTKTAQIRMCGNSVCPPLAAAILRANVADAGAREVAA